MSWKWSRFLLLFVVACSATPRRASVAPGAAASSARHAAGPSDSGDSARAAAADTKPAPPVVPPASVQVAPSSCAPVSKDSFALPEALAMIESVCERDLVARPWTDSADHVALFGICQALAKAHDEEARQLNVWRKDRIAAAELWRRATKVDLWFDPPARMARLELARLDGPPRRETFCTAIGALSPPLWCWAELPLEQLATANSCEQVDRCTNTVSKPPKFDMRRHLDGDPIDRAALAIARNAVCAQVVNEGDALLQALARKMPGGQGC